LRNKAFFVFLVECCRLPALPEIGIFLTLKSQNYESQYLGHPTQSGDRFKTENNA